MTAAQASAQDATVQILRRYADEAEAHLRAQAARRVEAITTPLCPCGIAVDSCLCPLRPA